MKSKRELELKKCLEKTLKELGKLIRIAEDDLDHEEECDKCKLWEIATTSKTRIQRTLGKEK